MTDDTAIATTDISVPAPDTTPADPLTPNELQAIAERVLDEPQYKLWRILHTPHNLDGRTELSGLCAQAGYLNVGRKSSLLVAQMFGRLESIGGISRTRSFDVMCGFTKENVKLALTKLIKAADEKIAVKAVDIQSKCLDMQSTGHPLTVNVNVQVNQAVSTLVKDAIDDED